MSVRYVLTWPKKPPSTWHILRDDERTLCGRSVHASIFGPRPLRLRVTTVHPARHDACQTCWKLQHERDLREG